MKKLYNPRFIVQEMSRSDAQLIATWKYERPYDIYNLLKGGQGLIELLSPAMMHLGEYFSVRFPDKSLVGFFRFIPDGKVIEIQLGLRPDLTGKRYGCTFVEAGLAFAKDRFKIETFRMKIPSFYLREARLCRRLGFEKSGYEVLVNKGQLDILFEMTRPVDVIRQN